MAKNTYRVFFDLPDGGKKNKAVSTSATDMEIPQDTEEKSFISQNLETLQNSLKKLVTVGTGKALAEKLTANEVSLVSLRTGAKEYEQKLQFEFSILKQASTPITIAATTGNFVAAGAGVAFSLFMQGLQFMQNQRVIDYNRDIENIAIGFARNRAGVDSSRGTRQ